MDMNAWVSLYQLDFRTQARGAREGFLLKVINREGVAGYSDCFSWPELGDPSREELLNELGARMQKSVLLRASIARAYEDAQARFEQRSLIKGHDQITNHFLFMNLETLDEKTLKDIADRGFRTLKVKVRLGMASQLQSLFSHLKRLSLNLRVRLDFNGGWDSSFAPIVMEDAAFIDFLEDPLDRLGEDWMMLEKRLNVAFAQDFARSEAADLSGSWQIVKPARCERNADLGSHGRQIFTSYLGHPVGQAQDMAMFLRYRQKREASSGVTVPMGDHGFFSHDVYKPNAFSESLSTHGPSIKIPEDVGIGFSKILKGLSWTSI